MNKATEITPRRGRPTSAGASRGDFCLPKFWSDRRKLKVLGMGTALPGQPVSTTELLTRIEKRFGVEVSRRGAALANRLKIDSRYLCRDFEERNEVPRRGDSNPELAVAALRAALDDAHLAPNELAYVIGHTTTPGRLTPSNTALAVDGLSFEGPFMELRQACTGFANALVVAQGILSSPGIKAVAIVSSETGSVYFDPRRAQEDTGQLVNLVMMGDGAAAVVLGPDDSGPGSRIAGNFFGHVGLGRTPGFSQPAGGSDLAFIETGALEFEHDFAAVRAGGPELFHRGAQAAAALGMPTESVNHIIPHQANGRMNELLGSFLGIEPARVFVNADRLGNTGSAAIWLALADLRSALKPGASVLALGAEASKYMFGGFHYVHG